MDVWKLRTPAIIPDEAETRRGDKGIACRFIGSVSRDYTGHVVGIRDRGRDGISKSCLVLGNATGNSFPPCLRLPRLQGHAGMNGHVLILILKTHPGKINFSENPSLGQAGSKWQPEALPGAGWSSSALSSCGASGEYIDLQQTGDSVHPVEDAERQADVDDGCPERVTVKVHLHRIAEVRAGAEGGHDPQLWVEGGKVCIRSLLVTSGGLAEQERTGSLLVWWPSGTEHHPGLTSSNAELRKCV